MGHIGMLFGRTCIEYCSKYHFLCSEMFHASRWLHDTRLYSPMAFLSNGNQAFVRDCVRCHHPAFGVVNCIIVKYYVVVSSIHACI